MHAYKKYPSCDDYMCVAKAIVGKYPFMKAVPPDPPCVSIILLFIVIFCLIFSNSCIQVVVNQFLINHFKEFCHQSKPPRDNTTKDPQVPATSRKVTNQSGIEKPSIPTGEDEMPFARHNQVFKH